jgi:N-methylhydantoinase A/oxoprolinase/acetone carboxylase beta subunit
MTWRLGIDIGGTFTDFALLDQAGHKLAIHKQLTTPSDPSIAVVDGIKEILKKKLCINFRYLCDRPRYHFGNKRRY